MRLFFWVFLCLLKAITKAKGDVNMDDDMEDNTTATTLNKLQMPDSTNILSLLKELGSKVKKLEIDEKESKAEIRKMKAIIQVVTKTALGKSLNEILDESIPDLLEAAKTGNNTEVKQLITAGVNIEGKDSQEVTSLQHAAKGSHFDIMKFLLEHGANPNAKNIVGETSLMKAVWNGHSEIVRLLLQHGADVNAKNIDGTTSLMAYNGQTEIMKTLVEHGADVNAKNIHGWTVLMRAADYGETDFVKLLLEHGADINAKNDHGGTCLMGAAMFGNPETVKILIEHGAGINTKDVDGNTALDMALMEFKFLAWDSDKEKGKEKAAEILKEYGAKRGSEIE